MENNFNVSAQFSDALKEYRSWTKPRYSQRRRIRAIRLSGASLALGVMTAFGLKIFRNYFTKEVKGGHESLSSAPTH